MPPKAPLTRAQKKRQDNPLGFLRAKIGKLNTRSNVKLKAIIESHAKKIISTEHPHATKEQKRLFAAEMTRNAERDIKRRENQATAPTRSLNRAIVTTDRLDFTNQFRTKFWRDNARNPCADCGLPIAPKDRSIDHIDEWSRVRIGLPTEEVCKDGVHWVVVFQADMLAAYQDEANLQPMHKSCNSSKGGPQGNDSVTPQKLPANCLGNCALSVAT